MQTVVKTFIALDVGTQRIGVAIANTEARLASPLTTLDAASAKHAIEELIRQHNAAAIVVGLPRGLSGQSTEQTRLTKDFIDDLKQFNVPVYTQDEAVTSIQAEAELKARARKYTKGDIDALAATYILEDFLRDNPEVTNV